MMWLARAVLRGASLVVPRWRRASWLEEWRSELHALGSVAQAAQGMPSPLRFVLGSIPHAAWLRVDGWQTHDISTDLRLALRGLTRAPGFALAVILTLALGIGANGAIFSLVNTLVLRTPPGVSDPESLVQIGQSSIEEAGWAEFSWQNLEWLRDEARAFEAVEGWSIHQFGVGEGAELEYVLGHFVTGGWFDMLRTRPATGRLIGPADDVEPGAHPVVVLGHGFWVDRFGADPSVIGRILRMDGDPYEIVGVAPEGYVGVHSTGLSPRVFVPAMMNPGYEGSLPFGSWRWSWVNLVGRLGEGVDLAELRTDLAAIGPAMREAHPDNADIDVVVSGGVGLNPFTRDRTTDVTRMLVFLVTLVLVLTCTNVANLFVARAAERETEEGIRVALGAPRGRLVRHLFTESTLLSAAATLLAVPSVILVADLLPTWLPLDLIGSLAPDARVWWFLAGLGLLTALVFGAVPAWISAHRSPIGIVREAAATRPLGRTRLQSGLVVVQLALSVALVTGSALLARSLGEARQADPGFESRGLIAGFVGVRAPFDTEAEALVRLDAIVSRLNETPGIRSASVATQLPIAGGQSMGSAARVGRDEESVQVELNAVGGGYFETLGIPLLAGRALGGYGEESERVVVINASLAAHFWPGDDPVGQYLEGNPAWRIVGVVPDVRMRSLRAEGNPAIYVPLEQDLQGRVAIVASSAAPGEGGDIAVSRFRDVVEGELPNARVSYVDVRAAVLETMAATRSMRTLVAGFAALALALAVVGLYGLVSYGASRRAREFGVRIALGARPASLSGLVLRRVTTLTALGLVLGVVVSIAVGRALRGLLFGVSEVDPLASLAAVAILVAVSFVAAWVPARRAARVDPVVSLRDGSH